MEKEAFIEMVSQRILAGKCDLFVGSGISSESHLPSWRELLYPLAKDCGIEIDEKDNLPMIAQYIVNNNSGNRNILYSRITECYEKDYPVNKYHNAISKMSIHTVWTTNYDLLLEKCFDKRNPRIICRNDDLPYPSLKSEFEIIKIHGSVGRDIKEIVLTQQDYDECLFNKEAIAQKLRDSFIQKSFLFIGYGYRDPDIRNIMIEASKQVDKFPQDHFIIMFNPYPKTEESSCDDESDRIRFALWRKELNRIGIKELLVNDSDELEEVLMRIAVKSRGKSIYVSGSHMDRKKKFYGEYGKRLAEIDEIIAINGQNQGVGINVINGFIEKSVIDQKELLGIMKFYLNPYAANPNYSNDKNLLPQLKSVRQVLFLNTKLFVVFAGGMGTEAEVDVAKENGCLILVAINKASDYENALIEKLLKDEYCMHCLESVPRYLDLIRSRKVPSLEELVNATEVLINA